MIFVPESLKLEIICRKFDDNSVSDYSGTSRLGHLHSRDLKFCPGKCLHNLCTCDLYLRDTHSVERDTFSMSRNLGLTFIERTP